MGCSYELFLAVSSLQRRSFPGIHLKEITAALDANGLAEVAHVQSAHIDDYKMQQGGHASLPQFFLLLQKELREG